MKLDELISQLEQLRKEYGNLEVDVFDECGDTTSVRYVYTYETKRNGTRIKID